MWRGQRPKGQADRLRADAHNQRLSHRRAQAVKDYLASAARADTKRVSAAGMSRSQPCTEPDGCRDSKLNQKLIGCLQPD